MGAIHARLAHVGVYAHDKPKLVNFYQTVLGLLVTDSGEGRNGRSNGLDTISEPFDFRLMPGATAVGSQEDCTFKRTTPSTVPRCNRSPISACSPGIDMLSS